MNIKSRYSVTRSTPPHRFISTRRSNNGKVAPIEETALVATERRAKQQDRRRPRSNEKTKSTRNQASATPAHLQFPSAPFVAQALNEASHPTLQDRSTNAFARTAAMYEKMSA